MSKPKKGGRYTPPKQQWPNWLPKNKAYGLEVLPSRRQALEYLDYLDQRRTDIDKKERSDL